MLIKRTKTLSASSLRNQRGLSLIELMIGITISLIILAGVITTFVNMNTASGISIKSSRLNTELRMAASIMTRELQRSGYVNAWDEVNERIRTTELAAFGAIGPTAGCDINAGAVCTCILYQYDADDDFVQDANEFYGFRINNNRIQMKNSGAAADDDCNDGNWGSLTSEDIAVTNLTFSIPAADGEVYEVDEDDGVEDGNTDCDATDICLDRRKVNIVITGQLVQDATVTQTINTEVKLMNDRYYTGP
jgi:prepilin-type N-terminal cleavage/methylation domain-containing protein